MALPSPTKLTNSFSDQKQLGFTVPDEKPEPTLPPTDASSADASSAAEIATADEKKLRDLHTLLLETEVREGKLVCGNCGHEYRIKEGIANFLLPSHLGEWIVSCIGCWLGYEEGGGVQSHSIRG